MRTPLAIVAALGAMLSMGATAVHARQTVKIGTTPSFIFSWVCSVCVRRAPAD